MNTDFAKPQCQARPNTPRLRLNVKAAAKTAANVLKQIQRNRQSFTFEDWHRLEFRREYPRKRYFGENSL